MTVEEECTVLQEEVTKLNFLPKIYDIIAQKNTSTAI